ncbi:MAG: hypothetical protein PWP23_2379 [Candidatus Sumerlaeota bacterium]|nr:hypothetical protein [Candidatus Sumerlaeota bacterium]
MTSPLLIGTSGHYYDEWRGVFYPSHVTKKQRLSYYASVFPALEINATYYGTPKRESARRMVREAAGRLSFSIKAPGDMTHRVRTDAETVSPFLDYIAPFREAEVLVAVLLQFPNALRNAPHERERMRQVFDSLTDLPLAVELRHSSWDTADADDFLRDNAVSRVTIDQPSLRGLSRSLRHVQTGPLAYFRFHGRNASSWYGSDSPSGSDRYRYRYTRDELLPWVPVIRDASEQATTTVAFFNNHPDGNAVLDALAFAEMSGHPLPLPDSGDLFS